MLVPRKPRFTTLGLVLLLTVGVCSSGFVLKHFVTPTVVSANDDERDNTLSTPPLTIGTSIDCVAANVGKTPVTLNIAIHDTNGTVTNGATCSLPAGAVNFGGSQCAVVDGAPPFVGYCTFEVTHGNKRDIRASILSQDSDLGRTGSLLAALPAQ